MPSKWSRVALSLGSKGRSHLPRGIDARKTSWAARWLQTHGWAWLQTCTIAVSVGVHAISTVPGMMSRHGATLTGIEGGSSILLAVDYLLRLRCCQHNRRLAHNLKRRQSANHRLRDLVRQRTARADAQTPSRWSEDQLKEFLSARAVPFDTMSERSTLVAAAEAS